MVVLDEEQSHTFPFKPGYAVTGSETSE